MLKFKGIGNLTDHRKQQKIIVLSQWYYNTIIILHIISLLTGKNEGSHGTNNY